MRRPGVGGSVAAAFIFYSLLACNIIIVVSSEDRAILLETAEEEHRMPGLFDVGRGLAAFAILSDTETLLRSATWDCRSAKADSAAWVSGLSASIGLEEVEVRATSSSAYLDLAADNLSMVAPYNGSALGALNIYLVETGTGSAGTVVLSRTERHVVHLATRIGEITALCISYAASIASVIESQQSCDLGVVGSVIDQSLVSLGQVARSDGFLPEVRVFIASSGPCVVGFGVQLTQWGIDGPLGPFSFTVAEEGRASPLTWSAPPSS